MKLIWRAACFLSALAGTCSAAPCVASSLAAYEELGATGCTIGIFTFKNFDFEVVATNGEVTPLDSGAIDVTPAAGRAQLGLRFSSDGFSVTGNAGVTYDISYVVDPPPIIFRFGSQLTTETPVFPGRVDVATTVCSTVGVICPPGVINQLGVFHAGTSSDLTDQVLFPLASYLDVQNIINLQGNGASADFTALDNRAGFVPEPGTYGMAAVASYCLSPSRLAEVRAAKRNPRKFVSSSCRSADVPLINFSASSSVRIAAACSRTAE